MHPILAKTGRLGPYLLAWVPLAAILAALLVLAGALSWLEATLLAVPLCLVYAFLCLSSWYICRGFPLHGKDLGRVWGTLGLAALIAGALWVVWATTVASVLGLVPEFATLPDRLSRAALVILALGVLLYLLVVALHYVLIAIETAREHERQEAELRGFAQAAELKALKQQLNPHFLFNSLNSISALTAGDPARAREMCLLLSEFLRKTLGVGDRTSVTLREEIALARHYLAVEQVRFGDRLRLETEVDPASEDCPIPPLLLQPLVENAVKHGIAGRLQGGVLKLTARRNGDRVQIAIENPCEREAPPAPGQGVGLSNVRRRVFVRYGSEASVRERSTDEVFRVEISLPFRPQEA